MDLCPVDKPWIHTYLIEPYLKGSELINRAWVGVDQSLSANPLSLQERVICWIQGFFLMIPLLNTIVWLAWQILGNPGKVNDPFCPEVTLPLPPLEPIPALNPLVEGQIPDEQFSYREKMGQEVWQSNWTIQNRPDFIHVQQRSENSSTISRYWPDFTLKEMHYEWGAKQIDFRRQEENRNRVHVRVCENGIVSVNQEIELEPIPWIQQRIGFKPFVLSNEMEMVYNAIVPEYPRFLSNSYVQSLISFFIGSPPFVTKTTARKIGIEAVAGFGNLLKIEVFPTPRVWLPQNTIKSELWFDSVTGQLKKFIDSGLFILTEKSGELVQNNQLPGLAHP